MEKRETIFKFVLPAFLSFLLVSYMVVEANYGDTAWFKAIANGDYGNEPYATQTLPPEAMPVTGTPAPHSGDISGRNIFNIPVACVAINTDKWGFPEHYDPLKPEVPTANAAIEGLRRAGYGVGGQVVVVQGESIKVLPENSPELAHLANGTAICVPVNE